MRYELADDEWIAIKTMLPNKPRGVPRVNDRRVLNGIFWVLRGPGRRGGTCRTNLVHIRPAIIASLGGDGRESGSRLWMCWPLPMTPPCR
jgi:hypothetical protein